MTFDELLAALFAGQPHPLAEQMAAWLATSRRFVGFAAAHQAKIRKKLRTVQDAEGALDLRLELETAYLLLGERALGVVYEPLPPGQARGPDFAVSYTTSTTFMLEVTRLRAVQPAAPLAERLADTLCSKLGQLAPQHSNVLLVGVEALQLTLSDLRAALVGIQQRAERNDAALLRRHHMRDRADFFQRYQRLSEVLVCDAGAPPGAPPLAWANPQAKHPLPGKVRAALYRSQRKTDL